jgi:hypothetical protein
MQRFFFEHVEPPLKVDFQALFQKNILKSNISDNAREYATFRLDKNLFLDRRNVAKRRILIVRRSSAKRSEENNELAHGR